MSITENPHFLKELFDGLSDYEVDEISRGFSSVPGYDLARLSEEEGNEMMQWAQQETERRKSS